MLETKKANSYNIACKAQGSASVTSVVGAIYAHFLSERIYSWALQLTANTYNLACKEQGTKKVHQGSTELIHYWF